MRARERQAEERQRRLARPNPERGLQTALRRRCAGATGPRSSRRARIRPLAALLSRGGSMPFVVDGWTNAGTPEGGAGSAGATVPVRLTVRSGPVGWCHARESHRRRSRRRSRRDARRSSGPAAAPPGEVAHVAAVTCIRVDEAGAASGAFIVRSTGDPAKDRALIGWVRQLHWIRQPGREAGRMVSDASRDRDCRSAGNAQELRTG